MPKNSNYSLSLDLMNDERAQFYETKYNEADVSGTCQMALMIQINHISSA